MTNPMNPTLIQALSALPALTEAQPVQTSVTVTFDQIVRTHNACSDVQNNLKRGFKAHFGRDLRHDEPLTMGMIEISATEGLVRAHTLEVGDDGKKILFGGGVSVTYMPPEGALPLVGGGDAEAVETVPVNPVIQ